MNDKSKTLLPEPPLDEFEIRCPRLGHQLNFSYCKTENNNIPCFKTLDCWYDHFDVHTYFKNILSDDDFQKAFQEKSKPKVLSLLDLIEQAKQRKGK